MCIRDRSDAQAMVALTQAQMTAVPYSASPAPTRSGGGGGGYNNQGLTNAQVREMQSYYGAAADGLWGAASREKAGGLSAGEAWDCLLYTSCAASSPPLARQCRPQAHLRAAPRQLYRRTSLWARGTAHCSMKSTAPAKCRDCEVRCNHGRRTPKASDPER